MVLIIRGRFLLCFLFPHCEFMAFAALQATTGREGSLSRRVPKRARSLRTEVPFPLNKRMPIDPAAA